MIINSPAEVAFNIFNFPVYWYGIVMAVAILVGIFCAEYFSKDIRKGFFLENAPILIIAGLLGARLYYCVLNFYYYLSNPLEIINIRQGGLSIHGMIIFGILFVWILAKRNNIKFLDFADVLACAAPLAQSIGRWGNFFNSEAFGIPTDQTWGLFIDAAKRPLEYLDYSLFHPTFLYESLLDFVLFLVLVFLYKKSEKSGVVFFAYMILYSLIRIFVEYFRLDSALNISGIPIAQIVSVIFIIIGVIGLCVLLKRRD